MFDGSFKGNTILAELPGTGFLGLFRLYIAGVRGEAGYCFKTFRLKSRARRWLDKELRRRREQT
jgi:hypothetical protein